MTENTTVNFKLRVPSHMEVTTVSNLWKFVQILPKLPDKFENSDIIKIEEYPLKNENTISRTLAYLKYLGVISEERIQDKETNEPVQFFNLTDSGKELKRTAIVAPENLFAKWKMVLRDSELYKSISADEEFISYNRISKITLRKLLADSFSKKVVNTKDRVDRAEEYIIKFLKEMELFNFDGDFIIPMKEQEEKISKIKQEKEQKISESKNDINEISKDNMEEFPKEKFYHAKTEDYFLYVKYDSLAIEMLRMQINIAEKKLEAIKNQDERQENKCKEE